MLMLSVRKLGCLDAVTQVLDRKEITIGRYRTCDVVLDDGTVAGEQCQLIVSSRGIFAIELGASSGTFVNGRPINHPVRLSARDTLSIGSFLITVRSTSEQSDPASAGDGQPHQDAA